MVVHGIRQSGAVRLSPLLVCALLTTPVGALAQGVERGTALERAEEAFEGRELEDFEQRGIRTGKINIFPTAFLSVGYNDNVLAAPDDSFLTDVSEDIVSIVGAGVRFETNTPRHFGFLDLTGELGRFEDLDGQNYDDWAVRVGGRWDITRTLDFGADAFFINDHETADDPDRTIEDIIDATEINRFGAGLAINKRYNRGFIRLTSRIARSEFDDVSADVFDDLGDIIAGTPSGTVNVNEGRDVTAFPTNLRFGFDADRNYDVFADFGYRANRYDRNQLITTRLLDTALGAGLCDPVTEDNAAECFAIVDTAEDDRDRDFDSFRVLVGTEVDFDRLLEGEFGVGLEYADFSDAETDDNVGFSFEGDLDWTVAPRTLVNFAAAQGFRATADGGTLATDVGATLTFAVTPKSQVGATALYGRDDRQEVDRTDDDVTAGVFYAYNFNRYLSVGADYTYRQRFSTDDEREFSQNAVFITLRGQY